MGSEGQLGTGGDSDVAEPAPVASNAMNERTPVHVSAGGQHTVLLVEDPNAIREESPVPEPEREEQKTEDTEEEEPTPAPEKKPKGRANKRQKKQEQEEEVSSTSSGAVVGEIASNTEPKVVKAKARRRHYPQYPEPTPSTSKDVQSETKKPDSSESLVTLWRRSNTNVTKRGERRSKNKQSESNSGSNSSGISIKEQSPSWTDSDETPPEISKPKSKARGRNESQQSVPSKDGAKRKGSDTKSNSKKPDGVSKKARRN